MYPARAPRDSPTGPQSLGSDQDQGIHSIWDSLGRLRTELRKMKHRLDDAGEDGGGNGGAALSIAAAVEAISGGSGGADGLHSHHPLLHHQQQQVHGHMPVDQARSSNNLTSTDKTSRLQGAHSPPPVSGSRRKVSRLDTKGDQDGPGLASQRHVPRASSSSSSSNNNNGHDRAPFSSASATTATAASNSNSSSSTNGISRGRAVWSGGLDRHGHGLREDSPKRVDFSRAHHLREVKWDGTYQDSLAFPSSLNADSTLTNSRDIRETDIRFLNFSQLPPYGPQETNNIEAPTPSPHGPPPSLSSSSSFSPHLPSSPSISSTTVSSATPSASSSATSSAHTRKHSSSSGSSSNRHHHHRKHQHRHQHNQQHNDAGRHSRHPAAHSHANSQSSQQQQLPSSTHSQSVPNNNNHHHHLNHQHQQQHHPSHSYRSQPATDVRWNQDGPPPPSSSSSSSARWAGGSGLGIGGGAEAVGPAVRSSAGHHHHHQQQLQQHQASNNNIKSATTTTTTSTTGPKLTRVDFHTVTGSGSGSSAATTTSTGTGSGTGGGFSSSPDGSSHRQSSPDYVMPRVRRQVEEKWASRNDYDGLRSRSGSRERDAGGGGTMARPLAAEHTAVGKDDWRGGSGDHHAGGVARGLDFGRGFSLDTPSPKRPLSIKKPITADLKDNEIMLKLKERLKQQRTLAASSQSNSNDTSLVDSNSSESSAIPPALPPRQPLTGNGLPKTRKVAAAHPSPSYRGFSDATKEAGSSTNKPTASTKVSSKKKSSGSSAKKSLQLQTKRHDVDGIKTASHPSSAPPPLPPERPKKPTRVVASSSHSSGDKKHSGAKNMITTSSWRAGQELILRELGSTKVKTKTSQGDGYLANERNSHEDRDLLCGREPDGAEAGNCASVAVPRRVDQASDSATAAVRKDPVTEEVMAKAKLLSEDARNMLNELQLGSEITGVESKVKIAGGYRPAVKRKAPKVTDTDKQQPREKSRHYDSDSVRKFMAKQKADRIKRQQEERQAHVKASERRETCMKELVGRQKKQAQASARTSRRTEEDGQRREVEGMDFGNKENVSMDVDNDDESTLTEDSDEDSTPKGTPRQGNKDQTPKSRNNEVTTRGLCPNEHAPMEGGSTSSNFIEFQGQRLNLDKDNALSRFSQVVNQRRNQPNSQGQNATGFQLQDSTFILSNSHTLPGEETAFAVGSINSVAKNNEERKQAIRATALTLQNRLAEEAKKLEGTEWPEYEPSPNGEFVSRYNRIAGNQSDYAVFSSDLPGSHSRDVKKEEQAAARIQAAYRGHNVRQALNWELPSGQTFGQRMRASPQGQEYPDRQGNDDNEEGSQLSDSSTFSEITATEPSDGLGLQPSMPANKKSHHTSHRHKPTESQPPNRTTTAVVVGADPIPSQFPDWAAAHADPYSVMSVFSRQSKYRIAGSSNIDPSSQRPTTAPHTVPTTSSRPTTAPSNAHPTDAFVASLNLTSLKQPVITSEERVVVGQTSSGQPLVTRARYTRLEATVSEPVSDDVDGSNQNGSDDDYSEDVSSTPRDGQPVVPHLASSLRFVEGDHSKTVDGHLDSQSVDSDDDVSDNKTSHNKHSTVKKSTMASYVRQVSDAGQETDVSQMSEDEPRSARTKKHDNHSSTAASRQPMAGDVVVGQTLPPDTSGPLRNARTGRLSPNSLGNKMAASLNYLESVEESLRQTVGMERARAVSLAQQESVALATVMKARQQEHNAELRQLQLQAHQEALEAQKQLEQTTRKGGHSSVSVATLLEKEDNRRPESRSNQLSLSYSSAVTKGGDKKSDLSQSPGNRRNNRVSASASLASVTQVSSGMRSARSRGTATSTSVKTAEDSYNDSDSSIKTASDADARDSRAASVAEEIQEEESYSMSFDESFTDEESFRQVLPSESHRKELRRQSSGHSLQHASDVSSHVTPYGDLSSLFAGEDSFNKFTADMVRQIMKEEEYRAQHQTALLSLREKALKEKAKAELAWLKQLKQQPRDKRADDIFPNLDKKEKTIRKNLMAQQAEIRKLQEANKVASLARQKLLQQHEEIAKIKENTQSTLQKLQSTKHKAEGRLARPPQVHTEDEIEEASDVSEDVKDTKSDSEMYRDKSSGKQVGEKEEQHMKEKIEKLHLDHKYMTAREQMLYDRRKQARQLLEWKKRLDEEEQKVFHLEKKAIEAWSQGKHPPTGKHAASAGKHATSTGKHTAVADTKKDESTPAKKTAKVVPPSKKDDSNVISDHMLSSFRDETAADPKHRTQMTEASISEVISTQISGSKSEVSTDKKSRSRSDVSEQKSAAKKPARSPGASGSESSIPEEVPSEFQREEKQKGQDSSDDTLINSSVNDDYADTFEHDGSASVASRKKLPVGKLLPQGNSPLPSPWSRKAGSESESEDSISHTETLSDASDYEVRIRQLSDELRRRRKEVEILKKERHRRQKDKLKAQEESMKKQLETYNNCILQLKADKDSLEQDAAAAAKSAVRPQIKQPKSGHVKSKAGRHGEEISNQSSSFEDMRDSTDSNQTSPSVEGKDLKLSPMEDKDKKKIPVSLMDRISEGSESLSDKSAEKAKSLKIKTEEKVPSKAPRVDEISEQTSSSSIAEVVEDASQLDSLISEKTSSNALKIQTSVPVDKNRKISESGKEDDASYSMDFSETNTLAQSHKGFLAASRGKSEVEISENIEEASTASSKSPSQQLKFNFTSKSDAKANEESAGPLSPPTMGIQESDSETESRVNSYHTSAKSEGSSRPSSERSVGSMSYSAEDDDEDEDIVSYGSDKTPVKGSPTKLLPPVSPAPTKTEEDISEHISASLPSISDKRSHSRSLRQDSQEMLNDLLGYKEEDEDDDDKTPVPTPREMALSPGKDKEDEEYHDDEEEEDNASLLMTDPLADFHINDRVLIWGRKMGTLKFKGKVDFSPGIWAGVELDDEEGDSDGLLEGKRYFSCQRGHGIMVHGSDISAEGENETADTIMQKDVEVQSPDESLTTDQDDSNVGDVLDAVEDNRTFLNATDASMVHSTPISSPHGKGSETRIQKPDATPVKEVNATMADAITDHLTATILEDTVDTMGKIASKKIPPPTMPKPRKANTPVSTDKDESLDPSLKQVSATDHAADGVMDSLLNEAISHMMSIKRRQAGLSKSAGSEVTDADSSLMNGDIEGTLTVTTQKTTNVSASKELSQGLSRDLGGGDFRGNEEKTGDSGISMDPFQRPGSPVPGDAPTVEDREELNDELAGLLGEYIEDDLDLDSTARPIPSSYTGEEDSVLPPEKGAFPEDIPPVVPKTKEEIAPIVAQVVDIFWTHRRYGESLDEIEPSEDYLCAEEDQDFLSAQSCRSWRRMLFDLAREVIQEIYKDEDKPDTPAWQKARHSSQKYFKGNTLPTTIDTLRPAVEAAVFELLDMNGNRKNNTVNKWNIRKKKDAVDAVLVHELGEEEKGWVDYHHDEMNLKMNLTNSIFDSLLSDTVHTLNGIYHRKSHPRV